MNDLLKPYIPMVKFIAEVFGDHCEVILHDLTNLESSIIAISNNHVTGRQIGGHITDFGLSVISDPAFKDRDFIVNYEGHTDNGKKTFRSSTFFIRDDQGTPVGLFCINYDITSWLQVKKMVDHLVAFSSEFSSGSAAQENPAHPNVETFSSGIDGVLQTLLNRTIYEMGGDVIRMLPEEKRQVVAQLSQRGFFNLKGAVSIVAKRLDVSEQTVYRYLRECQD